MHRWALLGHGPTQAIHRTYPASASGRHDGAHRRPARGRRVPAGLHPDGDRGRGGEAGGEEAGEEEGPAQALVGGATPAQSYTMTRYQYVTQKSAMHSLPMATDDPV